jgi:hypothetical protein
MNDNIKTFNQLLTRAIGIIYNRHPAPVTLGPAELWDPPLTVKDPEFQKKKQEANGTLMWLYRNGIVGGDLQDFGNGDMLAISNALLTTQGYRIANTIDPNENGKTVGQIAVEALSQPSEAIASLVARRFT